jgi:hypothetical protein
MKIVAMVVLSVAGLVFALMTGLPSPYGAMVVGLIGAGSYTVLVLYLGIIMGSSMTYRRGIGVNPSPAAAMRDHALQQDHDDAFEQAMDQVVDSERELSEGMAQTNKTVAWRL